MRISDWSSDVCSSDLKPGGRFVGEFGGHGNVAAVAVALLAVLARRGIDGAALMPWYFPTAAEYRARLEAHGFTVDEIRLIPRPTPLPTGMAGWLETFAEAFFRPLSEDDRTRSEEHTSELQSLMRIPSAVFCLKK